MILRSIAILGAAALTTATAHAAPCTLTPGDTSTTCKSTSQQRLITLTDTSNQGEDGIKLYRGGHSVLIQPEMPEEGEVRLVALLKGGKSSCTGGTDIIPDFGFNTKRYEVCLTDLESEEGLDVAAAYERINTAVNRTCRANGAITYPASKFCRRDTLYRAIIDTQRPALTAYYTAKTGRVVPRVEIDPAKTY